MESYTVDMTREAESFLLDFARRHGISMGETIGMAVGLLALADDVRRDGNRIGVVKEVGEDELEAVSYVRGF